MIVYLCDEHCKGCPPTIGAVLISPIGTRLQENIYNGASLLSLLED